MSSQTTPAPLVERVGAQLLGLDDEQLQRLRRATGDPERPPAELRMPVAAALAEILPGSNSLDHLLWIAATTSTKRVIATAVLLVLREPALRVRLQRDPGLLGRFIDEAARLRPPAPMLRRVTSVRTTLGGVSVPADSVVLVWVAAANRDPGRFEDPDSVRLDRSGAHLAFGAGRHRCPGAGLTRIEAEAALRALFRWMPDFRSAQPACALRWIPSVKVDGLEQMVISDS